MNIRMNNMEIEPIGNFLLSLELKGKSSRMRTRFIKILQEQAKLVRLELMDIIKQYAVLDEEGNPKTSINENKDLVYDIKEVEQHLFEIEVNELYGEIFTIEVTESNKEMIKVVRNAVIDCDRVFSGQEAMVFDRYCEIMEGE
jgi:hypothetical protein